MPKLSIAALAVSLVLHVLAAPSLAQTSLVDCCLRTGECVAGELTPTQCEQLALGEIVADCSTADCPDQRRACCLPDGNCVSGQLTPEECESNAGGTPSPGNTECSYLCPGRPCTGDVACDDGSFCNGQEACVNNVCVAGAGDPCANASFCASSCDETNDVCTDPCEEGSICDPQAQECTAEDPCAGVDCSLVFPATVCEDEGVCDPSSGDCLPQYKELGSPCDDGDACTVDETCNGAGGCSFGTLVNCSELDDECNTGACDSATGCVAMPKADGTPCPNTLFCDGDESCQGGACVSSGDPCTTGPQCADVCNESVDNCFDPAGTPCDDLNKCTSGETCNGEGACTGGGPAILCSFLDDDCNTGVCNSDTGECERVPRPDGTACTDNGLFCDGVERCMTGACVGSGDPCVGGPECARVCDEEKDACADPEGTPCDDGQQCTNPDTCDGSGGCAGTPRECPDGQACDPSTGECVGGTCCQGPASCLFATAADCEALGGEPRPGEVCRGRRCEPTIEERFDRLIDLEVEASAAVELDENDERALELLREASRQIKRLRAEMRRACPGAGRDEDPEDQPLGRAIDKMFCAQDLDREAMSSLRRILRGDDPAPDRSEIVENIDRAGQCKLDALDLFFEALDTAMCPTVTPPPFTPTTLEPPAPPTPSTLPPF